ncbi:FAD-dependent oxidoreductase [Clostridium saccharoperbutylacetonicum]|uniref:oxidoreductase n=1 Tax=Clostridium saccharoperbutylacetonicum TaxID=36745 RepID=UPI0039E7F166
MSNEYDSLFTPLKVGSTTIKNRIVLCAMEGTNLVEGMMGYEFNKHCHDYYVERAKNDVALMVPGMVTVKSLFGDSWLGDQEEIVMGPVKKLIDEIHSYDAKVFMQIGAGMGRAMVAIPMLREQYYAQKQGKTLDSPVNIDVDRIFRSPSAGLPNVWDPEIKSTEMSKEEIHDIVKGFGKAAALCKKAGIDGVEIHAVHEGYLLDQFTIAATNHRTDEYGGSLENRFRFVTEIIQEIKRTCGVDYPVSVRYSVESKMLGFNKGALPGEEYIEFGRNLEEGIEGAKLLEAAGADMLNADNGSYDSWFWAHPPLYMPLSCNLDASAAIKPHVNIPVVCAGRMEDPNTAAQALLDGKIDGIGIARQLLCDGEYVSKIREDRIEDIRPCLACHNGCFGVSKYKGNPGSLPKVQMGCCAINPTTLQEQKYQITPSGYKKHVAVIGGGIGGMEVARLCSMRGHDVTLYEKTNELGGVFIAAGAPDFKEKDKMLIEWYKRQIDILNIDVKLNTEIKEENLLSLGADELIIATGATPRKLAIQGAERDNVMEAIEYLRGKKTISGNRVAVIGGGLTGCEIAYDLILKGKKPVIIEMMDDILKIDGLSAANSNFLRDVFRRYETPLYLEAKVVQINGNGIVIATPQGEQTIEVDSVVTSIGYIPSPIVEVGNATTHIIGDALKVGNLMNVVWGAYDVALSI